MKISKRILVITLMLFLFFASGCSKNLLHPGDIEPVQPGEEIVSEGDVSSSPVEKADPLSFSAIEKGMQGDASAGAFSTEPGTKLSKEGVTGEEDSPSRLYEKPGPRSFGSAGPGMPGNGASGSFSAEPFTGSSPEPDSEFFREESVGEGDTPSHPYEKPDPRKFGSAQQGMPGDGATGSFSAEPFSGDSGEGTPSHPYEKPDPRSFGSAEQGMPGDGATGSFSAEPFLEENGVVAQLPPEEKVRRQLAYSPSDRLQDIHFDFDKFDLTDQAIAILKQNAAYLKDHPNSMIEIQGHCDERGSNNYNIALGERRTQSTKSYLVSLGVDESKIHTISYGEERPFCFESNEKCWYQNRRGHFLIAE